MRRLIRPTTSHNVLIVGIFITLCEIIVFNPLNAAYMLQTQII